LSEGGSSWILSKYRFRILWYIDPVYIKEIIIATETYSKIGKRGIL